MPGHAFQVEAQTFSKSLEQMRCKSNVTCLLLEQLGEWFIDCPHGKPQQGSPEGC